MTRQFMALRNESHVILDWRGETQPLYDLVARAADAKVSRILVETLGEADGKLAFEQFKEMFRLTIVP